ncbi:MAG: 4-hydroxy-tetrahydrodipicolinate synthase [Ilumatobacteraceae bacterium]
MIALPVHALRGSIPPLVTPFADGRVDYDTYACLVEHHVEAGSHGVVVCGTTGEPSVLTEAERRQLAVVAIDAAGGRIEVIVASGSQSHAETVALTEHAGAAGADAVLVVTPYYIKPPRRGLVAYFGDLAARTDLPLLIYNIPGRAAVGVDIGVLTDIAEIAPTFVGMKHAAADLTLVTEVMLAFGPEFRLLVGLEELSFPMLALGAAGMVNAVANVVPAKVVELYEAVTSDSIVTCRRLHQRLFELNRAVFFDTNPIPVKYMMWRLGLLPNFEHRLPMMPATPELAARLDRVLLAAGLDFATTSTTRKCSPSAP